MARQNDIGGGSVRGGQPSVSYANVRFWPGPDPDIEMTADFRETEACDVLAPRMGVRPGTRLVECKYRSRRPTSPAPNVIMRSYMRRDVLGGMPKPFHIGCTPWGDEFCRFLANAGVELNYVVERLSARSPTPQEVEALGVSPGAALLAVDRTSFDSHGRVAEVADTIMSGERIEAVYTMTGGALRTRAGSI